MDGWEDHYRRRIAELEAGMREIRAAAIRVGDGETREALEHCAVTAMEVTTRVLRDLVLVD